MLNQYVSFVMGFLESDRCFRECVRDRFGLIDFIQQLSDKRSYSTLDIRSVHVEQRYDIVR